MITGGILWCALHGAQVANLSFGGKGDDYDGIKSAINFACSAGMDLAVASGNDGVTDPWLHHAAIRSPCLVSVNALDQHNRLTSFSNYGEGPRSISAPGSNLAGDSLNGSLMIASGTSVAAPLVAGTLVLLRGEGLDAQTAVQVLLQSAAPPPARPHSNSDKHWTARYGAGILDAGHAVQLGRELLEARDTELQIERIHEEFR
jgi:subtilisin family serine protease